MITKQKRQAYSVNIGLKVILTVMVFFTVISSFAQSIVGANSVYETNTRTYTYTASAWFEHRWVITKGVIVDDSENGTLFTVVVKWTSPGAGSVKLEEYDLGDGRGNAQWISRANRNVTVNACPVLTVPTMNPAARCGPGEISISGTPGTNGSMIVWYETVTSTVSYASGTSKNFNIYAPVNTFYVATLSESTGCESAKASIPAYVNPIPVAPSSSAVLKCGTGSVQLDVAPGSNGNTVKWYANLNEVNSFYNGNSYSASGLTSNTTYFISSWNSITGCESPSRANVDITVDVNPPPVPEVNGFTRCGPGAFSLTATGHPAYNWYSSDLTYIQSGSVMPVPGPINETLLNAMVVKAVNSSGCESTGKWISLQVLPIPQIIASGTVVAMAKPIRLEMSTTYDSYSWNNQYNEQLGTQSQLMVNGAGTYHVIVSRNGIYNGCKSNEVTIEGQIDKLKKNFIITNTIQRAEVLSSTFILGLNNKENQQSITYFDGLGRQQQTVLTQHSTSESDLVQAYSYDVIGRENKKLLPYQSSESNGRYKKNALVNLSEISDDELVRYRSGEQFGYYQTGAAGVMDAYPHTLTVFEMSPLSKVIKTAGPGEAWQPNPDVSNMFNDHAIKKVDDFNTDGDRIYKFTYNFQSGEINAPQNYAANSLRADKTYDESNKVVIEFTDKEGRMICKKVQSVGTIEVPEFASTYYIYDDFGNLVLVLPPEGVEKLKIALNLN